MLSIAQANFSVMSLMDIDDNYFYRKRFVGVGKFRQVRSDLMDYLDRVLLEV